MCQECAAAEAITRPLRIGSAACPRRINRDAGAQQEPRWQAPYARIATMPGTIREVGGRFVWGSPNLDDHGRLIRQSRCRCWVHWRIAGWVRDTQTWAEGPKGVRCATTISRTAGTARTTAGSREVMTSDLGSCPANAGRCHSQMVAKNLPPRRGLDRMARPLNLCRDNGEKCHQQLTRCEEFEVDPHVR